MNRISVLPVLLLMLSACAPQGAQGPSADLSAGVVYGEDSRRDPNVDPRKESPAYRQAIQASATLMRVNYLAPARKGSVMIRGKDIKKDRNLCPEVRFNDQPSASYCSAVLIGPDKVLTAGHCVETGCDDLRIVFGWTKYTSRFISGTDVYKCKELIDMKLSYEDDAPDMAIIQLDRKVVDRKPIEISKEPLKVGDDVFIVGYPWGLPQKISTAKVRKEVGRNFVQVNSDTFSGDSGGPVFSADGQLKGLLIGGEKDYVEDTKRSCKIIKQCKDDECRGEDVLRLNDAAMLPHPADVPVTP